jgi:hypothetical protein
VMAKPTPESLAPVYHFTDTVRMPWIIETGELRPSNNFIGNFPKKDFLWATTNELGDRTSSAQAQRAGYREGMLQLVRFTLPGEAFADWREIVAQFPAWKDHHIEALVKSARWMGESENNWRARAEPLPISSAIAVHAKPCKGGRWVPIAATSEYCITFHDKPLVRGFVINGAAVLSATRAGGRCPFDVGAANL